MSAHNTHQWDGPVCMHCSCGDQYVIQPEENQPAKFWREVGVVTLIAAVVMAGVLLMIQFLERMILPW